MRSTRGKIIDHCDPSEEYVDRLGDKLHVVFETATDRYIRRITEARKPTGLPRHEERLWGCR